MNHGPLVRVAFFLAAALTPVAARAQLPARYLVEDVTPPGAPLSVVDYDFAREQAGGSFPAGQYHHAALWDLDTGRVTDLHPSSGYFASEVRGVAGGQQVGIGNVPSKGNIGIYHALLWRGTAASRVDLNPAGALFSAANDTDGVVQGGAAFFGQEILNTDARAALWRGTASSYVDLTPTHLGINGGGVMAIEGGRQVGYGMRRSVSRNHRYPLLWTGTAASAVELAPPTGFNSAFAYELGGAQVVGEAFTAGRPGTHAAVWLNEQDPAVDLHPAGFSSSTAWDTNGLTQIGTVVEGTGAARLSRAAAWSGSADSFINLHDFLPAGYVRSGAAGVDPAGNVHGFAVDGQGLAHQVVWRAVPEPSALAALAVSAAALLLRRRRALSVAVAAVTLFASAPVAFGQARTYVATELVSPGGGEFVGSELDGGTVVGTLRPADSRSHAALWDQAQNRVVDLHPGRFSQSFGTGAGGGQQAGWAFMPDGVVRHALVWRGTAASLVDLHPTNVFSSTLNDTDGTSQVGFVQFQENGNSRAALWRGTASAWADLTPAALGFDAATATTVEGNRQVGFAWNTAPGQIFTHGILWNGTAASAVELLPVAGYTSARIWDLKGNQQVGVSFTNRGDIHFRATIWDGTPDGAIDLTPAGFTDSDAQATNGFQQAGTVLFGTLPGQQRRNHAAAWAGTPESWVDLHQFLPGGPDVFSSSGAFDIDAGGVIHGGAVDANGQGHYFVWTPVPEPSGPVMLPGVGWALALRRDARRGGRRVRSTGSRGGGAPSTNG